MPQNSVDLSFAIGLKPSEAIKYFESKGYVIGFNWYDVEARAHASAFTVAGVLKQDILHDIRNGLSDALKSGEAFAEFDKKLIPLLEQKGWLGKGLVADEDGVLQGKRLTPRRLDTIFDTNMKSNYSAGRYIEQLANKEARPYLERIGILDGRIRPKHVELNGFIAHIDDPIWQILYPPDGYKCRCRVRSRSAADLERRGLTVQSSEGRLVEVEQPWGNGETRTVTAFKNPFTNELYVPDAGFGHNPGSGYLSSLGQRLLDRGALADTRLASIAVRETFKNETLLNAVSNDVGRFVEQVLLNKNITGQSRHVGALPLSVIETLTSGGTPTHSAIITLTSDSVKNTAQKLPDSIWQALPKAILTPEAIVKESSNVAYIIKHGEARYKIGFTPDKRSHNITAITPFNDALNAAEVLWGDV